MRPSVRHLLLGGLFGDGRPAGNLLGGEMAGFAADFINRDLLIRGKGDYSGDPDIKLTYTTPSTKYVRTSAGVYTAGTTLRCDYLANGTALGLLVEGQRTNGIRNNSMQGVSAGSPGTLPTNWGLAGGAGLTQTVVGSGTENGVEYIDIRLNGTTSGTSATYLFDAITAIAAVNAQVRTVSAFVSLVGGSFTNVSAVTLLTRQYDSGSVLLSTLSGSDIKASITAGQQRFSAALTMDNASTAYSRPGIILTYSSAVAIDVTLRIGWPQEELGAHASSPIRTTSAAVTRAADSISIATSALPFSATVGTLLAKVVPGTIATGNKTLVSLREDANNYIRQFMNNATKAAVILVGGATQTAPTSGSAVAGTAYKGAFSWEANDFAFSVDGGAAALDASGTVPSGLTIMGIGSLDGANPLEGWIQQLIYLPREMSDAELVTWSTL